MKKPVIMLRVHQQMTKEAKEAYLAWFCASLTGTVLEEAQVILLEGGADVRVYQGDRAKT